VTQKKRDRSLTTTLLLITTAQIALSTTIVILLTTLNGQRDITHLAGQIMESLSTQTENQIQYLLKTPQLINRSNSLAVTTGQLDPNNPQQLNQQFWNQKKLYQNPTLAAIYYGSNKGEFTGLGFQSNQKWEGSRVSPATQNRFQSTILNDKGQGIAQQPLGKPYDPRKRPWYIKAQAQAQGTWSDIYKDFSENRSKISLVEPIYTPEGQLQGVFGTDFILSTTSEFLNQLDLKGEGEIYLIDRQGTLIASNQNNQFAPTLQQITQHFGNLQTIQNPQQLSLPIHNHTHFLNIRPFGKTIGLDWLIVISLPQSNFTQQIEANTRQTLILALLALILALLSALLTSRWLTRPINQLSQAASLIAQGQFDQPLTLESSQEVNQLRDSFNHMRQNLSDSRHQLQDYATSLEAKVRLRTLDLETEIQSHQTANQQLAQTLTHLQTTQQQLIQSEKLALLGQLVASVAHEINSPLGAIRSSASSLTHFFQEELEQLPDFLGTLTPPQQTSFFELIDHSLSSNAQNQRLSSEQRRDRRRHLTTTLKAQKLPEPELLADILVDLGIYDNLQTFYPLMDAADRLAIFTMAAQFNSSLQSVLTINRAASDATQVVQALKTYAHRSDITAFVQSDIIEGLENSLIIHKNLLKRGITVLRNYDQPQALLPCIPSELNQIWNNLISNAIQAMQGQGKLTLTTEHKDQTLEVHIEDTGSGIPSAHLDRIFDPFFTTKVAGEGTGIGLSLVKTMLDQHHATIEVTSRPGHTHFTIRLPFVQPSVLTPQTEPK
jgi:signal transduction histidine kinase